MAIEIIPKPKFGETPWTKVILYVCLAIIIVFFLSYFFLTSSKRKLEADLIELKTKLERIPEERILEDEVFKYQRKIEDFAVLLNLHQLPLNFFILLEENTHPEIWFFEFELSLENNSLVLLGQAGNFEILGQQMLIFQKQESIKNMNLSNVSIDKQGKIEFELQLTFDPKIFK